MNNLNRRPLKVRETKHAKNFAKYLSSKNITPNQISIFSIVFSVLAAICLLISKNSNFAIPFLAALFIQCRLLCNLFDGMVAVEGYKKTNSGELYNDIPDRISDIVIFVAAPYSVVFLDGIEILGWCAALLSVMTAYVRTLAASIGAPNNFAGPMAKQHRMAIMTFASLSLIIDKNGYLMFFSLIIIIIGSIVTIYRRIISAYNFLEK